MSDLSTLLADKSKKEYEVNPTIFDFTKTEDQTKVEQLISSGLIQHIVDDYEEELLELFGVKNPSLVYTPNFKDTFRNHFEELKKERALWQQGLWVYYPWRSALVHVLPEADYFAVRTAR